MSIEKIYIEIRKIIESKLIQHESAKFKLVEDKIYYTLYSRDVEVGHGVISAKSDWNMCLTTLDKQIDITHYRLSVYNKIIDEANTYYKKNYLESCNMGEEIVILDAIFDNKIYDFKTYEKFKKRLEENSLVLSEETQDRKKDSVCSFPSLTQIIRLGEMRKVESTFREFLLENMIKCIESNLEDKRDLFGMPKERDFYELEMNGDSVNLEMYFGHVDSNILLIFNLCNDDIIIRKLSEDYAALDAKIGEFVKQLKPELELAKSCVIYDMDYLKDNRLYDIIQGVKKFLYL